MGLSACSGGGDGEAAVTSPTTTTDPGPSILDLSGGEGDPCVPVGGGGADVAGGVPGADPYSLGGARQRPGPDMTTRAAGTEQRSIEVERPGDPDADSPAKNTTTTTLPGTAAPAPTTTTVTTTTPSTTTLVGAEATTVATTASGCLEIP